MTNLDFLEIIHIPMKVIVSTVYLFVYMLACLLNYLLERDRKCTHPQQLEANPGARSCSQALST